MASALSYLAQFMLLQIDDDEPGAVYTYDLEVMPANEYEAMQELVRAGHLQIVDWSERGDWLTYRRVEAVHI